MAAINGRWSLTGVTNALAFLDAINSPDAYKAKIKGVANQVQSTPVLYEEEFVIDTSANTVQIIIYVNGELIKDHGAVKCDEFVDHISNDGRPTKLKTVINSDTKFTTYEIYANFDMITEFELTGDTLTLSSDANGQRCAMIFKRSA